MNKGQAVTLDAVFALFIVIFAFIYMTLLLSETESPEMERLGLERKASDSVSILLDAEMGGMTKIAEGSAEELQEINARLAELKEKMGLSGIRLGVGTFKTQAGQPSEYGVTKRIIVPAYNSTEFMGGEVTVWV